jgi:hypothetical protein
MYGAQLPLEPATQLPVPSQVDGLVKLPLEHVPGAQLVPDGQLRQLPLPSHLPSCLHVEAACALHVRVDPTGDMPEPTGEQIPRKPVTLHALQASVQAVLQQ